MSDVHRLAAPGDVVLVTYTHGDDTATVHGTVLPTPAEDPHLTVDTHPGVVRVPLSLITTVSVRPVTNS